MLEIDEPARPADELPDLAESWAWAHAQLSVPLETAPKAEQVAQWLASRPELSIARLICPRRLAAHTDYIACVVPAFEAGRRAGLALPPPEAAAALAPAWASGAAAPTRIELPVYHHWSFATGEAEDFETLVDRLQPRDLSAAVGRRQVDITSAGLAVNVPPAAPPIVLPESIDVEGALQPVGRSREAWPTRESRPWQLALQAVLNTAAALPPPGADALVGPPIYGRWAAGRHQVALDAAAPTWLDELNLDPRERIAAGLGTRVVQAHQEEWVAEAWARAGEMAAANQQRRQIELAGALLGHFQQRHVQAFVDAGQDDALWRFVAPAQARLMVAAGATPGAARSLQALIADSTAPDALLAAPLRRLTRPRGALARRAALVVRKAAARSVEFSALATPFMGGIVSEFALPVLRISIPGANGFVSLDDASLRAPGLNPSLTWAALTDLALVQAPQNAHFQVLPEPISVTVNPALLTSIGTLFASAVATTSPPPPPPPPAPLSLRRAARPGDPVVAIRIPGDEFPDPPDPPAPPDPIDIPPPPAPAKDNTDAAAFRAAARRLLARLKPAQPPIVLPIVRAVFDSALVTAQRPALAQALDARPVLQARLQAVLQMDSAAPAVPAARTGALAAMPRLPMPVAEPLARLSQDWLLPGLQHVPADTVALLEPNRRFIEAYMAGLNVEMARELLWRDFPLADERATVFDRFWRSTRAAGVPDIAALADWGARRLGRNTPADPTGAPVEPRQSVLLLRSPLLQRYPGTAVYAVPAELVNGKRQPSKDPTKERLPVFRGGLQPDVSFFGFDLDPAEARGAIGWYFVLQQQPTEPRFGFDSGTVFDGASHVSVHRAPGSAGLPAVVPWARHGAEVAHLLRQQPVRVLIHASELLPAPTPA